MLFPNQSLTSICREAFSHVMDQMLVPPDSYVEVLIFLGMALGGGNVEASGRSLWMRSWRWDFLVKRRALSLPYKETARKYLLWTRKKALTKNSICWHFDFGLRRLRNGEKSVFVVSARQSVEFRDSSSTQWRHHLAHDKSSAGIRDHVLLSTSFAGTAETAPPFEQSEQGVCW